MSTSWIYLSPHFDDVALSCGGLVWEQTQLGEPVSVWTICAGDPPEGPLSLIAESLHERWQTGREAPAHRREEDLVSCKAMGASTRHFTVPDCIYRRSEGGNLPLYASDEAIMGPLHPLEALLVDRVRDELAGWLRQGAEVVCPLAIRGHVDHRLVRLAAEKLDRALWYYADYPYVLDQAEDLNVLDETGWKTHVFPISASGLAAWQEAVAAYASQISTFWPDLETMRDAISTYCKESGGVRLWRAP